MGEKRKAPEMRTQEEGTPAISTLAPPFTVELVRVSSRPPCHFYNSRNNCSTSRIFTAPGREVR